jgi:hypothetical protein
MSGLPPAQRMSKADIAALRPPQILKAALKGLSFSITFGVWHQHSDAPHGLALLRAYRERPRYRRSAEKRYELAPAHVRPKLKEMVSYRLKRVL